MHISQHAQTKHSTQSYTNNKGHITQFFVPNASTAVQMTIESEVQLTERQRLLQKQTLRIEKSLLGMSRISNRAESLIQMLKNRRAEFGTKVK
jgi:hypothetical protein